ncbi:hypothetical protein [Kutzneria chonburiensis]|uniref:Nephrocystin 3-like N-terminal domain-containing protein n=1 Tax=Kutzneria chonburiensis TaxID=1483604 RepID=A0ABV6MPM0_9PSEU|nr:hypothetical protein [Kutzneria chonburiensis]
MATSEPERPADLDGLRVDNVMSGTAHNVVQAGVIYGGVHITQVHGKLPAAVLAAYRAQVRDTAPDQLLDRDAELAELTRFCTGDAPYAWWQAGPWAGKSALAAWFVLHPPVGVDVVAFFVSTRHTGQSDSGAFVAAVSEQLAALLHQPTGTATAGAKVGDMLQLLEDAAAAGRRLLLVIDGLDEDTRPAGLASVAALLPRRPPPSVRVLVTSRPGLRLPDDVPDDHPLRTVPIRELAVSPHASEVARLAGLELDTVLSGPQLQRDLLGLIAASGGGLTADDLAELTEHPAYEIRRLLQGTFGRSLSAWIGPPVAGYPSAPVHLFSHETLRELATQQLGRGGLRAYHRQLATWADSYQDWPVDTPQYLLRAYPQALAAADDLDRLTQYATDQARHRRMRILTGGDLLGLTEIRVAQQALSAQHSPDLIGLGLLAIERDSLLRRTTDVPAQLAAVWTLIGQPVRAEGFAAGMQDWGSRRDTLLALVEANALQGNDNEAIRFAADLVTHVEATDPMPKAGALVSLVSALAVNEVGRAAAADLIDDLVALVDRVEEQYRDFTLALVAEAVARTGDFARAELIAGRVRDLLKNVGALVGIVRVAVAAGDLDRTARLAREADARLKQLADAREGFWLRLELVTAMAGHGDAEVIASAVDDTDFQARVLTRTAVAVAATDPARARLLVATARQAISRITFPQSPVAALVELVDAQAALGDLDAAASTSGEVETLLSNGGFSADGLLGNLARIWSERDDLDRAETLVGRIVSRDERQQSLVDLARVAAIAGDHARAARLADEVDAALGLAEPHYREVLALAETGHQPQAERALAYAETLKPRGTSGLGSWLTGMLAAASIGGLWDRIRRPADQAEAIMAGGGTRERREIVTGLAVAVGSAGDRDQALRLIAAGEQSAYEDEHSDADRAETVARLAVVAVTVGDTVLATRLADDAAAFVAQIGFSTEREEALAVIGSVIADLDRAEAVLRRIADREVRLAQLTKLVGRAGRQGDRPRAVRLAREVEAAIHQLARLVPDVWSTTPQLRARALATLVNEVAAMGDGAWTAWIADSAESYAAQIDDPARRAGTLSALALAAATGGDRYRAGRLAGQAEALIAQHSITIESDALARVYALGGNFDRAAELARGIVNMLTRTLPRAGALVGIAQIAATAGDGVRVRALVGEVLALARGDSLIWPYGTVFANLVTLLAVGDPASARQIADEAEQFLRRETLAGPLMRALAVLVKAIALTGDAERCLRLADLVEELSRQDDILIYQAEAMANLIEGLTTIGQHDRVTRLIDETLHSIEQVHHPDFQVEAYASLVRAVSVINRPTDLIDRALEFIDQIPYPEERDQALIDLARANAALGRLDLAAQQAELISELPTRAKALAVVAAAGVVRLADSCEAVLARIDDPTARALALLAVVDTLGPHDPRRAERLLSTVTVDDGLAAGFANALAGLAATADNRGRLIPRARRAVAAALTTAAWRDCLKGLALLDPLAVATIADEQLTRWGAAT